MSVRRRICVVTTTRAEYGLLSELMRVLHRTEDVTLQIIATGTHLSPMHGMTITQIEADGFHVDAQIPMPLDDDSGVGLGRAQGVATIGFAEALDRLRPDILVLLGDRYELLAAAQAATLARVPIAHLHGGEATEGVIDEAVRHALTKLSHLHFVAAEVFRRRLLQMGEAPDRVWTVGATGLDVIARLEVVSRAALEAELGIALVPPLALVTYHPETLSADNQSTAMAMVLAAVADVAGSIIVTGVNADPGSRSVRSAAQAFAAKRPGNVALVESLGATRYLSAMMHADVVVGNSSSGLLEAPSVGTPTVDVGDRQRGRPRAPSVIHCAATPAEIRQALANALSPAHKALAALKVSPYGEPGAAGRIATVLRTLPLGDLLLKRFNETPAAT